MKIKSMAFSWNYEQFSYFYWFNFLGNKEALLCPFNEIPQMDINTDNNNITNPNMEQMIIDNR